jgi:hypothetical protein
MNTTMRSSARRRLTTALALLLLTGGGWLAIRGLWEADSSPQDQPLPAQLFALDPGAARHLPTQPALTSPQPGSLQRSCSPLPQAQAQVSIASLCIYASMVATTVEDNALIIPSDVHQVGLDTTSAPLDARRGTSIVAGHVDNISQGAGVFHFLHLVRPGAEIAVTDLSGVTTKWVAYKTDILQKADLPADIWSTTGPRRLVLVTCGGPLVHARDGGNTYKDNVLVYATPA